MTLDEKRDMVKDKVTIPEYFAEVIVPNMEDYFVYPTDFEGRPYVQCPMHGEDTPSLRYYDETNTYYCFGCGSGGDVIQLHREYLDKCRGAAATYLESIEFLYGYFVKGKEIEITERVDVEEVEYRPDTTIAISRFNKKLRDIEDWLMNTDAMTSEEREIAFEFMDDMEMLVNTRKFRPEFNLEIVEDYVLKGKYNKWDNAGKNTIK